MHVVENVRRYKVRERAIIGACNILHVRVDVLSHANTENSLSYSFPELKVNVPIAVTILLCWQEIAKFRYRPALPARVRPQRQHVPFLAVLVCTLAAYLVRYTLENHRATISKKHLIALLQYGFLLYLWQMLFLMIYRSTDVHVRLNVTALSFTLVTQTRIVLHGESVIDCLGAAG